MCRAMLRRPNSRIAPALGLLCVLAACGDDDGHASIAQPRDPIATQALFDPVMTDPDLVGQNAANAALDAGIDGSLPPVLATPDAIAAARMLADNLLADGSIALPSGQPLHSDRGDPKLEMLSDQLARLDVAQLCREQTRYSARWAAALPNALSAYPHGATIEALGVDSGRCNVRAMRYLSPVPAVEIATFHYARAAGAGFSLSYFTGEDEYRLQGSRGGERFSAHIRPGIDTLSEVDLVYSGD